MLEIDLPRMQSLSPHLDSPPPIDTFEAISSMSMTSLPRTSPSTSLPMPMATKSCGCTYDTEICDEKYKSRSGCGCKYINKVSWLLFICILYEWNYEYVKNQKKKRHSLAKNAPKFELSDLFWSVHLSFKLKLKTKISHFNVTEVH